MTSFCAGNLANVKCEKLLAKFTQNFVPLKKNTTDKTDLGPQRTHASRLSQLYSKQILLNKTYFNSLDIN